MNSAVSFSSPRAIRHRSFEIIMVSRQDFQTTSAVLICSTIFNFFYLRIYFAIQGLFFVDKTSQTLIETWYLNYCLHDCGNFLATRKAAVTIDCRYSKTFASICLNSVKTIEVLKFNTRYFTLQENSTYLFGRRFRNRLFVGGLPHNVSAV